MSQLPKGGTTDTFQQRGQQNELPDEQILKFEIVILVHGYEQIQKTEKNFILEETFPHRFSGPSIIRQYFQVPLTYGSIFRSL
jgi:hypothetical protein